MTIIGLGGCGISLRRPYVGLLLLVVLYFFRPSLWGAEQIVRPVLWLTIAVLIGWFWHRQPGSSSTILRWLIVLVAIYTISIVFAPLSDRQSWVVLKDIVKIFVVVFLIGELCDTPKKLAGLLVAILVGHLWFVKVALLSWAMAGFSHRVLINTGVGQGGGSNYIAWILATTTPLLVYKMVRGRGWERLAAAVALPLWLAAILGTGSRGGLLALGVGLGVLLVMMRQLRLILVLALVGWGFWVLAPQDRIERAQTITLDPEKMDASMLSRYQHIQIGFQIVTDHPFFGTGLGSFPKASQKYLPRDYVGARGAVAHNTLVQFSTEVGLIFLVVFLIMTLYVVLHLRTRSPDVFSDIDAGHMEWVRLGMLGALGATAVQMLKGDMGNVDYFWWLYGISMAYWMVRERAVQAAKVKANEPTPKPRRSMPPWLAARLKGGT
jgi:O-antigen ligase